MVLYGSSFINLIFVFRGLATAVAHVGPHCVTGIVLAPIDATFVFHRSSGCMRENEGKKSAVNHHGGQQDFSGDRSRVMFLSSLPPIAYVTELLPIR
jgi:hypothetical protein